MNPGYVPAEEKHGSYWKKSAATTLKSKLQEKINTNKAKNGMYTKTPFNDLIVYLIEFNYTFIVLIAVLSRSTHCIFFKKGKNSKNV